MSTQSIRAKAVAELERDGRLTPAALVEVAKAKNHPLHNDGFDWGNDKKAAYKYRLARAREIISSVRVVVTTSTQRISSISYVRDPQAASGKQGYVSVATLRNDVEYAQQALDAEIDRVRSSLERAREFASAVGLLEELELAMNTAMALHSRSRRGPAGSRVEERAVA